MVRATEADFVPPAPEILANISPNGTTSVTLHDGSVVRFTRVPADYDPTDRAKVTEFLDEHHASRRSRDRAAVPGRILGRHA